MLFGRVTVTSIGRDIIFEYGWGRQRENLQVPPTERYWTFPLAPWQREPITEKFAFDEL